MKNTFTALNNSQLEKIRHSTALTVYCIISMYLLEDDSYKEIKNINKVLLGRCLTQKDIDNAFDYLIKNEIMIMGKDCYLHLIKDYFNRDNK